MKFNKLKKGILIKRYKRFLTDVKVKNKIIQMYIPNTGPMKGIQTTNVTCYYSEIKNPKKMKYKIEFIDNNGSLIGVNTHSPNNLMEESLHLLKIDISNYRREYKIKNSKFDFLINDNILLEVKNVSCSEGDFAYFPDTVSTRAMKHLNELIRLKEDGFIPYLVFIIQRNDISEFTLGYDYYPEYCMKLRDLIKNKEINVLAFSSEYDKKENKYFLHKKIPINLDKII
jgi:sugar fermentation stimulation protein A